jgi:hypothetical protein
MVNVNYWRLDEMSNVLVAKNNKWIDVSIPKITSVWDTIKYEREKMVTVTESLNGELKILLFRSQL